MSAHDSPRFPPKPKEGAGFYVHSEQEAAHLRSAAKVHPEKFWLECAEAIEWQTAFQSIHEGGFENARWFSGGQLNVSYNCVGRHMKDNAGRVALSWEGEPYVDGEPEQRWVTYGELDTMVRSVVRGLRGLGVNKGDRVIIYMPMVPEIVASMLACAHMGAVHSVIFAGFSAQSIFDRAVDAGAKVILTASGVYRKGAFLPLYERVHEALTLGKHPVMKVVVWSREKTGHEVEKKTATSLVKGRDIGWDAFLKNGEGQSDDYEWMDAEDPLFILYTSGTTGKPKGLVHTQAGYLVWALWSTQWVFGLNESDVFWCTADCGWITGHTYVTYGPLALGGHVLLYEGAPFAPHEYRFWEIIERHHVSVFYTAPTALRALMRTDEKEIRAHDLSSLRLLGSVGEPINPEVWLWYRKVIGRDELPIVDTWWQTETGGIMIAPLPGVTTLKPGSATLPLPGIEAAVLNEKGLPVAAGEDGVLVIEKPWPSQARTIWGDHERYLKTYLRAFPGKYDAHDMCRVDDDGYFWILGRADDVINISGHRLGTAEVESALVSHPQISEAAVVGIPHEMKGQALAAFVVMRSGEPTNALLESLRKHVAEAIGAFARPDVLHVVKAVPKTRSGKIMRRLIRDVAIHGEMKGDRTTLEDGGTLEILL
jgi:acetyl-CoA synthetase